MTNDTLKTPRMIDQVAPQALAHLDGILYRLDEGKLEDTHPRGFRNPPQDTGGVSTPIPTTVEKEIEFIFRLADLVVRQESVFDRSWVFHCVRTKKPSILRALSEEGSHDRAAVAHAIGSVYMLLRFVIGHLCVLELWQDIVFPGGLRRGAYLAETMGLDRKGEMFRSIVPFCREAVHKSILAEEQQFNHRSIWRAIHGFEWLLRELKLDAESAKALVDPVLFLARQEREQRQWGAATAERTREIDEMLRAMQQRVEAQAAAATQRTKPWQNLCRLLRKCCAK